MSHLAATRRSESARALPPATAQPAAGARHYRAMISRPAPNPSANAGAMPSTATVERLR